MRLYEGTTEKFIVDTIQNQISKMLEIAYEDYYGRRASPGETTSWTNSLQFLKNAIQENSLLNNMIILEYELPYSNSRIDCLLFGKGEDSKENVVLIELKQWSSVEDCEIENNIITFVGGAKRMLAHPSMQVRNYHCHLMDFLQVFTDKSPTTLSSCVYLHNYSRKENDPLFAQKFSDFYAQYPLFTKNDFDKISNYLKERLSKGQGLEIFNRFVNCAIKPSKKLIEYTKHMIQGQNAFHLIDEQLVANNTIIDRAIKCSKLKNKSVIIVRGGPGTGKSVIALNALAELLSKKITVFHATGSSAFTKTLRKIVGTRAAQFFKYFNSFTTAKENGLDVLICDEAHRIRKTSGSWYMKSSGMPQIDELMRSAKVCIFFIDDYQIVRPDEIGSTSLLIEAAKKYNAEIYDFELKTQFRCSGSDGYLSWIDNTLGIRETANQFITKNEKMEIRIFDNPQSLYEEIKKKNLEKPNSARLVAGYCWHWSDPNPDGTLKDDVVIDKFKMPWEAKPTAKKIAKGIPPAPLWAYDPNGVHQIGSIYTIQGFEFDYVGVIFGKDLVYDPINKTWAGKPENSSDPAVKKAKMDFARFIKNVYRVLLTRGMKGCYLYFLDKNTEEYFKSRIQSIIK